MNPRASTKSPPAPAAASGFDVARVRRDFPILDQRVYGKPLCYLDNAATTHKPRQVIEAIDEFYRRHNANIHRGVYQLSQEATSLYDGVRRKVARFLNAADSAQVIFTRGATEAINLVAASWGRTNLKPGDEVLLSTLEHHSDIVPWQIACEITGAKLRVIPVNDAGELRLDELPKLLSERTKIVAITHVSNALGTVNDVARVIREAHRVGAVVLVDGAQHAAHFATDVQALDADFYAFSGHKLYGPTGIGVLYGKRALLEAMPPYQGGGDMIESVTFEKTRYAELPNKFEAGTPHIAGAVGLGAAIDYVLAVGLENAHAHEDSLLRYATDQLEKLPGAGVKVVGTAAHKSAVLSFVVTDPPVSALDVGTQLDFEGVAVRTGHHCCQPLMDRFNIPATARASFAMYNTLEEVDAFIAALRKVLTNARAKPSPSGPAPIAALPPDAQPHYPAATADSPAAAAEDIAAVFEFLDDWQARYQQIMEFGEHLPAMPGWMKSEGNLVHGCQSVVHLSARVRPGTPDVLEFLADSDADIVRGLIAVLERIYSGQRAAEVAKFDIESFFRRIGLEEHLSAGRRNGLFAMVKRIRAIAADIAQARP